MSRNLHDREEVITELYTTIKKKFEEDGVLQEMRCMLQAKMVAMMRGKNETKPLVHCTTSPHRLDEDGADGAKLSGGGCSGNDKSDSRIQVLHQLIMEYFHWHGYQYSAEMFAIESATENAPPVRDCLEGVLGEFQFKNLPILLELVANLMEKETN